MPERESDLREVGIEELKVYASAVMRRVEAGQRLVVTRRRRPVALIIPMSEAEEFVLAYAAEFVGMRGVGRKAIEEGRCESIDALGGDEPDLMEAARLGRPEIAVAPDAASELRSVSVQTRIRALRALDVLARVTLRGQIDGNRRVSAMRVREGDSIQLSAGRHLLVCEIDAAGPIVRMLTAVHRSRLRRWVWSGGSAPLKVTVAEHLSGYPRRLLEDAD
jgi:prevent-host-death family protein